MYYYGRFVQFLKNKSEFKDKKVELGENCLIYRVILNDIIL